MPYLFPYAFTLIGPSLAKVPDEKPFVNALATKAAPRVPTILFLLLITVFDKFSTPREIFPSNANCTDCANPLLWLKLNAVPNSIALTLKDFFALRRGAFLLGAMLLNNE
jgi:hypothetical protein